MSPTTPRRHPLIALLTLPFAALIVAAVSLVGALSVLTTRDSVDALAAALWEQVSARVHHYLGDFLGAPQHLVSDLAELSRTGLLDPTDREMLLRHLEMHVRDHEQVFAAGIGLQRGGLTGVSREPGHGMVAHLTTPGGLATYALGADARVGALLREDPYELFTRPWYQLGRRHPGVSWTNIYEDYATGDLLISAVHPVDGAGGGVASAAISLRDLSGFLATLDSADGGSIFIIEPTGELVAVSDGGPLLEREATTAGAAQSRRLLAADSATPLVRDAAAHLVAHFGDLARLDEPVSLQFESGDASHLLQVTPFDRGAAPGWLIVAAVPRSVYLAPLVTSMRNTLALGGAALVVALLVGASVARAVVRPVERLNNAAKRVAREGEGIAELELPAPTRGSREVAELVESFRHMSRRLARAFERQAVLNAAISQSESQLRQVLEALPAGAMVHDAQGRLIYLNERAKHLLGIAAEVGTPPLDTTAWSEPVRAALHQLEETLVRPALGGDAVHVDGLDIRRAERDIPLEAWCSPVTDASGRVVYAVAAMHDVSERRHQEARLIHHAMHDALTGLANRSQLVTRLDLAIGRARRHRHGSFALLFLDLDRFKVVNDSLGHLVGDEVLVEVARRLRSLTRSVDLAARLGGDEFVLLIEDLADERESLAVADRVFEEFRAAIRVQGRDVHVSTSIGVVFGSAGYDDAAELLRDADIALYRAKAEGRARYAVFDAGMRETAMRRQQLEDDLRRAIVSDGLSLQFQPVVSLSDGSIVGLEALCRWRHPSLGWIAPPEFIALAEESGLIVPLDRWVMNEACRQLARWRRRVPGTERLRVSINLSNYDLAATDTRGYIEQTLAAHGLAHHDLSLELTEGVLIDDVSNTISMLGELRARGVSVSIDDFGTGYSSLSYLYNLPVDALKIDKAFVSTMAPQSTNAKIVSAVVALSNELGIVAVAEGVEAPEQLRMLQAMGCEFGQGYLFARPLAAEAVEAVLRRGPVAGPWTGPAAGRADPRHGGG